MRPHRINFSLLAGDNLMWQKLDQTYSDPERRASRRQEGKMTSPLEREIGGTEAKGALTLASTRDIEERNQNSTAIKFDAPGGNVGEIPSVVNLLKVCGCAQPKE